MTAQNINIRTNYVETKFDKKQKTYKCTLYGERDEKLHDIINEYINMA